MDIQNQQNPDMQKVADMVEETRFAMLTTVEKDGSMHSRPMSTMQMDSAGNLWFFTSQSSPKIDEAEQHRQVVLNYVRSDKQDYVSISGTAEVVRDKEKMKSLWTPWIKPWFPNGLDDPDLVLLKVSTTDAEYWDAPGTAVKRAYGLAKALATGNTDALGENKKVDLRQ